MLTTMRRCVFAATLLLLGSAAAAPAGQEEATDVAWLVEVLELGPGSVVADIGAGGGELTIAIAPLVGAVGRVYASELGDDSLERLEQAMESAGVTNVSVIEAGLDRTNLPEVCCDALFTRFVYHHFADPSEMNTSLWQSLKPGGRVAVIDFAPRGSESSEPSGRATGEQHGVMARTVANELREAGFTIVSAETGPGRTIHVVALKPAEQ